MLTNRSKVVHLDDIGPELATVHWEVPMPTHRDTPQDTDSAQHGESVSSTPPLKPASPQADGADEHLGATEEQVSETPAPAGDAFEDEPKQG